MKINKYIQILTCFFAFLPLTSLFRQKIYIDENFKIKFPMFENKGEMGVQLDENHENGAKIKQVETESAAEAAGLKKGDIIIAINGQEVANAMAAVELLNDKKVGEEVESIILTLDREERKM